MRPISPHPTALMPCCPGIWRDREQEFNAWYNAEHIPHLSGLPGVIAARRFQTLNPGAPRYVALYHVANTDIYTTQHWVAANETPWMLRMRRFQRNRMYFMFRTRVEPQSFST